MATVHKNSQGLFEVVFSDETTATFSKPSTKHLGLALTIIRKDTLGIADVLVDNCLVSGDKAELKANLAYARQLSDVADDVFGKVKATLTYGQIDGQPVSKIMFEDDHFFVLRKCDRATYSTSRAKQQQNPLAGLKHIITNCIDSDLSTIEFLLEEPGYLLGFSEVADEYLNDTGKRLGNS